MAVRLGKVDPKTLRVPVAFFFAAAAIYCVAAYGMGRFTRPMGLLMLGMFVAYMAANVWQMKNALAEPEHEEEPMGIGKIVLLLVVGAALIALGANLLVDNGTIIAQAMGVPESVIALTFVALGTSLPELVTAITSLMKGHSDLSLGNVVGANVFNLVLVSGVSVTLAPFEIPQSATLFGINSSLVLRAARDAAGDGVADHPGAGAWKALPCAGCGAALYLCRILRSAVYNVKLRKSTKAIVSLLTSVGRILYYKSIMVRPIGRTENDRRGAGDRSGHFACLEKCCQETNTATTSA